MKKTDINTNTNTASSKVFKTNTNIFANIFENTYVYVNYNFQAFSDTVN